MCSFGMYLKIENEEELMEVPREELVIEDAMPPEKSTIA